jgi:hypothetical protein
VAETARTGRRPEDSTDESGKGLDGFMATARKRFDRAMSAESENRQAAVDDLRFKNGDQWPEQIRSQRTQDKRPCLTINKMKTFVHQITNDQRQNRPAINVSPVGDKADVETAKMLKGLIKQIERQSNADIAYDTAFDGAVSNGWGYWRILNEYEGDDTFDQVLKIVRIRNPFRVYMDPDSQEPDGSDAKWCFISDMVPRAEFKENWPDADPLDWDAQSIGEEYKDWASQTHIRIAEYFCFETKTRKLLALLNGHIGFEDELDPLLAAQIKADPSLIVNTREVQAKSIKWYKLTAKEILEENDWLGKWIPVVKVIGDEIDIEGKVTLSGLVRDAKDPQRMYNFWCTSETELIALAPKAPWIMEEGQVEGHEQRWKDANVKSLPYLLYKGTSIAGKPSPIPQRQQFVGPPAGVVQAKIGAAQDMQAVTGVRFDATQHERLADESGKAMRELKRIGELGNYHYIDNLARSLRHTGRILIDLIPKVYDTRRVLTILREDDKEEQVEIDPQQQSAFNAKGRAPDGRERSVFNPKVGVYEVAVTIGPSFATKRAESADSMLMFMKAVPNAGPVIGDLIAKNMDWPGAEEIAARLAATLPPNLQKMEVGKFPPEAQALIQSLTGQLEEMQQQHKQALAMLGDKQADRDVQIEKINKDFEAKVTTALVNAEAKMVSIMGTEMKRIGEMVGGLEQQLELQNAVQAEREKAQPAEPKQSPKLPDIHVHLPGGGKKKISRSPDGGYIAEEMADA